MEIREQKIEAFVVWELNDSCGDSRTIESRIEDYIKRGWFIVSMTTVNINHNDLQKVIVVFERNVPKELS